MNVDAINRQLKVYGLSARYVPAESRGEDSELEIWRGETRTAIAVQIGEAPETVGFYFVTEHGGEGDQFWTRDWGEFRSLKTALKRAAEKAKP